MKTAVRNLLSRIQASDLWGRIAHPEDYTKDGQRINRLGKDSFGREMIWIDQFIGGIPHQVGYGSDGGRAYLNLNAIARLEFEQAKTRRHYCCGFQFMENNMDPSDPYVVLIRKQKPMWQKGRLNGVGGKVEADEDSGHAMVREFREEAALGLVGWRLFCTLELVRSGDRVDFFTVRTPVLPVRSTGAETITVMRVSEALRDETLIPNLRWLIPMAMDRDQVKAVVQDFSVIP